MAADLSNVSTELLQQRLKAMRAVQITVMILFGIILLIWIVPGLWRENPILFGSTVLMAVAISLLLSVAPRMLRAELERRRNAR